MEISFRPLSLFNRLFRKPLRVPAYKSFSNTVVKEEFSPELLNSFNQDIKAGGAVPVFKRALLFPSRIALQDECGSYSYATLYQAAAALSKDIAAELLGERQRTISYMCGNDASHVIVQWAIWMSGNIAVPLTPLHPEDMLKYFIGDSGSDLIICSQDYEKILRPIAHSLSKPLITTTRSDEKADQRPGTLSEVGQSNTWYGESDAMLIYTSGTTSQPKGVVWTHSMLSHQITALLSAWQYSAQDVVLHTLPLHHIHGQLNSLNATLAAGARIRMLPSFSSPTVWSRLLASGDREDPPIKVFHGVPAMYTRLANDYDKMFADNKTRSYVRNTLSSRMRLMCAGSAPLPETLFKKWEEITGVRLLERYGMSEVGMALSNPYRPVEGRTVGCVGVPLPGINAAIAVPSEQGLKKILTVESDMPDLQVSLEKLGLSTEKLVEDIDWKVSISEVEPNEQGVYEGELLLKGPAVFTRYWNRAPNPDSEDFTPDGWFRTGDVASFSEGKFKILGRLSVDIIKTGGYKVSALQVEAAILEHPNVLDVAVVGIVDDTYGEIVACVIVLKEETTLTLKEIKDAAGKKLAPYQLPKTLLFVDEMPRNTMGKLDKKLIMRKFGDKLVLK